jgi:chromosome segregation protein
MDIAGADAGELGLDSEFEVAKRSLDGAKAHLNSLIEAERAADRERNATESKLEAMLLTSQSRDGGAALVRDSRGLTILGSIASLVQIDSGWESATAAALGTLSDAIVVKDLNSAISALTTMRSENLGQADVLVYEPGSHNSTSVPAGLTALTSHVRSSEISELLASLLSNTVVAESARR